MAPATHHYCRPPPPRPQPLMSLNPNAPANLWRPDDGVRSSRGGPGPATPWWSSSAPTGAPRKKGGRARKQRKRQAQKRKLAAAAPNPGPAAAVLKPGPAAAAPKPGPAAAAPKPGPAAAVLKPGPAAAAPKPGPAAAAPKPGPAAAAPKPGPAAAAPKPGCAAAAPKPSPSVAAIQAPTPVLPVAAPTPGVPAGVASTTPTDLGVPVQIVGVPVEIPLIEVDSSDGDTSPDEPGEADVILLTRAQLFEAPVEIPLIDIADSDDDTALGVPLEAPLPGPLSVDAPVPGPPVQAPAPGLPVEPLATHSTPLALDDSGKTPADSTPCPPPAAAPVPAPPLASASAGASLATQPLPAAPDGPAPCQPAHAAAQKAPASAPAARETRTAFRRCGAEGATTGATAGIATTALSTAAALPTESATADAVFVFKATAENNAAVARGCASADQQAAPSNAKKRAAEEELAVAEPAVHPVLQVTKRARCDVVDVPLTRAIDLLVRSGAKLIYRTSSLRMRPDLADWTMAETPSWTLNHPLRYVPLDRSQGEYRDVAKEFAASCRGKRFTVRRICRVENDRLLYQFQERVRDLERRCGDVAVLRVYHGTLRDNVPSIAIGNLDKRLAGLGTNHFFWGEGVNFSPISYYASHYGDVGQHRSMMVCDVVVGRACSVRQPGKEGPVIPAKQRRGCQPGQRYDTNMKLHPGPQVICKFDDHQFYPAYIVDYTAPARGHRGPKEWEECRPWWYLQSIDLWTQTVASQN